MVRVPIKVNEIGSQKWENPLFIPYMIKTICGVMTPYKRGVKNFVLTKLIVDFTTTITHKNTIAPSGQTTLS